MKDLDINALDTHEVSFVTHYLKKIAAHKQRYNITDVREARRKNIVKQGTSHREAMKSLLSTVLLNNSTKPDYSNFNAQDIDVTRLSPKEAEVVLDYIKEKKRLEREVYREGLEVFAEDFDKASDKKKSGLSG